MLTLRTPDFRPDLSELRCPIYRGKHDKGGDSLTTIGKIVSGPGNTITREDPR
ncbi:hypothetical protein [Streptomyces sp. NRRL S-350]|uniref:hypothetical protein n=1 Tax=Streptomyces sp. NRRL S-350 TaxID=1463902 RepID=UPI000B2FED7F|nr:hypothetical protein [Streptomyces sp. NRRL S-350]